MGCAMRICHCSKRGVAILSLEWHSTPTEWLIHTYLHCTARATINIIGKMCIFFTYLIGSKTVGGETYCHHIARYSLAVESHRKIKLYYLFGSCGSGFTLDIMWLFAFEILKWICSDVDRCTAVMCVQVAVFLCLIGQFATEVVTACDGFTLINYLDFLKQTSEVAEIAKN